MTVAPSPERTPLFPVRPSPNGPKTGGNGLAPNGPFNAGSSQSFAQKGMIFISNNFSDTIHAAAHTPILASMVNAFDTEGPGIESLNNFVADGRGSYADEARTVTDMIRNNIYDAFAKLTMDLGNGHTETIFDVHLQGKEAAHAGVQSGIFALGAPGPDSFLNSSSFLNGLVLDPSIQTSPSRDRREIGSRSMD